MVTVPLLMVIAALSAAVCAFMGWVTDSAKMIILKNKYLAKNFILI
jgi:hypothetical protein